MDDQTRSGLIALLPRLRRQARFMVHDAELADDLVQDALTKAIANIHTWQAGTDLAAWTSTILRHVIITHWRRMRRRQQVEFQGGEMCVSGGQEAKVAVSELGRALQRLSHGHKQLLLLVAVEGVTYDKAAEILGLPLGTVRSRLSRARTALRELLAWDSDEAAATAEPTAARGENQPPPRCRSTGDETAAAPSLDESRFSGGESRRAPAPTKTI